MGISDRARGIRIRQIGVSAPAGQSRVQSSIDGDNLTYRISDRSALQVQIPMLTAVQRAPTIAAAPAILAHSSVR
jgi:hypothetical protein